VLYLISKIKPEDSELKLYNFSIQEFCQVCGIDDESGGNYFTLKNTVKRLADKSVWITLDDGRETVIRWIERPYIDKRNGVIQIKLDNLMKPYLLELKEKFTAYSLYFTLPMQSKYSIRLYELLKSYQNLKKCEFEIDRLKKLLSAEIYELFGNFKIKVLDVALKEINDYCDISVSYELEKQGKKIRNIKFSIEPKYSLPFDEDESLKTIKNIENILNKS
jgi:plasmid replication initiation protein